MTCNTHRGLSLLEVILALAILALCMAAIGELVRTGTRSAEAARDLTRAQLLCESKLSEIVAGVEEPNPIVQAPFPTDPTWYYTVALEPTEQPGIMLLRVTVETHIQRPRPLTFSLARWIPDPGIELPEEPEPREEETGDDSSDEGQDEGGEGP